MDPEIISEKPTPKEGDENTLTIIDAPVPETVAPKPTRAEKEKEGWSKPEIDSAIKRGLIVEKGEDTPPAPKPGEAPAPAPKAGEEPPKPVGKGGEEAPAKGAPIPKSGIPDLTLSPEKEAEFVKLFPPGTPQNGLYFYGKKERRNRQRAEQEREALRIENETLKAALKGRPTDEVLEIPEDDKPMTESRWREIQKQEREENDKLVREQNERRGRIDAAHLEHEAYARTVYKDFDPTIKLAEDLITNLETLIPDPLAQEEAIELVQKLQIMHAQADQLGVDQLNAAHVAYRIGRMHPKYGQKPDTELPPKGGPKGDGGLTPEKLKRIEQNANKKGSSASVPDGGGKRTITVEDVDLQILNDMDVTERLAFKKKYPKRYAELLEG